MVTIGLPVRRYPEFDVTAGAAGSDLKPELPLAELRQLAKEQLPAAARSTNPELLDSQRLQLRTAAEAGIDRPGPQFAWVSHLTPLDHALLSIVVTSRPRISPDGARARGLTVARSGQARTAMLPIL